MSADTGLDLVTGAFSYTGSRIAARLLDSGREVRTLTFHPDRPHPLRGLAGDAIVDGAGPETMSFDELVRAIRGAVGARSPILHLPPAVISAASRALGLLVHDVVLTPQEIGGLSAGLLISHDPPLGQIAFSDWLAEHSNSIGSPYANELQRHFVMPAAAQ